MDRGAWQATVHGLAKRAGHDLVTKQQERPFIFSYIYNISFYIFCFSPVKSVYLKSQQQHLEHNRPSKIFVA